MKELDHNAIMLHCIPNPKEGEQNKPKENLGTKCYQYPVRWRFTGNCTSEYKLLISQTCWFS
jgi:hypothetical protein